MFEPLGIEEFFRSEYHELLLSATENYSGTVNLPYAKQEELGRALITEQQKSLDKAVRFCGALEVLFEGTLGGMQTSIEEKIQEKLQVGLTAPLGDAIAAVNHSDPFIQSIIKLRLEKGWI